VNTLTANEPPQFRGLFPLTTQGAVPPTTRGAVPPTNSGGRSPYQLRGPFPLPTQGAVPPTTPYIRSFSFSFRNTNKQPTYHIFQNFLRPNSPDRRTHQRAATHHHSAGAVSTGKAGRVQVQNREPAWQLAQPTLTATQLGCGGGAALPTRAPLMDCSLRQQQQHERKNDPTQGTRNKGTRI
jgi:hypothetical protein